MGLLDRLFGRRAPRSYPGQGYPEQEYGYAEQPAYRDQPAPQAAPPVTADGPPADQQAVERYRYLLRTAPPDQIEQAHAEAFAQLTPDQRQQVLTQLAAAVPSSERPRSDDPQTLARAATRAELRQPGTLERAFGGGYGPGAPGYGYGPGGPGFGRGGYGGGYGGGYAPGIGGMIGGSLLGTIGGLVIGTAVADALFDTGMGDGGLFGGGDEEAYAQGYEDGSDGGDGGGDGAGDYGDGGGDYAGGDHGGGDLGGGDYGGGDFGGDF